MTQEQTNSTLFYADTKTLATFSKEDLQPHFLLDGETLKVIVAGLEAGQQIPAHPESSAMYHFLEGRGEMTVDGEQFSVEPGVTVIVQDGSSRGMRADTRLVFLAAKIS